MIESALELGRLGLTFKLLLSLLSVVVVVVAVVVVVLVRVLVDAVAVRLL